jgi:hypothetical protein
MSLNLLANITKKRKVMNRPTPQNFDSNYQLKLIKFLMIGFYVNKKQLFS